MNKKLILLLLMLMVCTGCTKIEFNGFDPVTSSNSGKWIITNDKKVTISSDNITPKQWSVLLNRIKYDERIMETFCKTRGSWTRNLKSSEMGNQKMMTLKKIDEVAKLWEKTKDPKYKIFVVSIYKGIH
jgi:transcriptional regulator NrdR family protein